MANVTPDIDRRITNIQLMTYVTAGIERLIEVNGNNIKNAYGLLYIILYIVSYFL